MKVLLSNAATFEDSVQVALSIRPLQSREVESGVQDVVRRVEGEPQVVVCGKPFTFDSVLAPATLPDTESMCERVLCGYNLTLLAYGQTGSGKTYLMGCDPDGNPTQGLIHEVASNLLRHLAAASGASCEASFVEVYNEVVYDLLAPSRDGSLSRLDVRKDSRGGVSTPDAQRSGVASVEALRSILSRGAANRKTRETQMNSVSSRSHALLTLELKLPQGNSVLTPKVQFVDLAGSERLKRTGNVGSARTEGIHINQGLLSLGKVINALCSGQPHVPYRDSKLTRLLQDSLGGSSVTLMVACVSPSHADAGETLNTLQYANHARQIKNKPVPTLAPATAPVDVALLQRCTRLEDDKSALEQRNSALSSQLAEAEQRVAALQKTITEQANAHVASKGATVDAEVPVGSSPSAVERTTLVAMAGEEASADTSDSDDEPTLQDRLRLRLGPIEEAAPAEERPPPRVPTGLCQAEVWLLKVPELKDALRQMGLDAKGKKEELRSRLLEVVPERPEELKEEMTEAHAAPEPLSSVPGTEAAAPESLVSVPGAEAAEAVPSAPGERAVLESINANAVHAEAAGSNRRRKLNMSCNKASRGWADYLTCESAQATKYVEWGHSKNALHDSSARPPALKDMCHGLQPSLSNLEHLIEQRDRA